MTGEKLSTKSRQTDRTSLSFQTALSYQEVDPLVFDTSKTQLTLHNQLSTPPWLYPILILHAQFLQSGLSSPH